MPRHCGRSNNDGRGREMLPLLISIQAIFTWTLTFRFAWLTVDNWKWIAKYQRTSHPPPLPLEVSHTQYFLMVAFIVFAVWSFFSIGIKLGLRDFIITTVIDLALVILLIVGIVNRARYIPVTVASCDHSQDLVPIGKLFVHLAETIKPPKGDKHDANYYCDRYQSEFIIGVIMSYIWIVTSILEALYLPGKVILIACAVFFFPVTLVLGIITGAVVSIHRLWRLWPRYSPPIKWVFRHVTWPLKMVWLGFIWIVPTIRFLTRSRRKRNRMERFESRALNFEKQQLPSVSSFHDMGEKRQIHIEVRSDSSTLSQGSGSPPPQARQTKDIEIQPCKTSVPKIVNQAIICEHTLDWQCPACQSQACSHCSVEIRQFPATKPHFYCEPRCSKCYLDTMCGILPKKNQTPCRHRQIRCKDAPWYRVCLSCSSNYSVAELVKMIEEAEREELRHLARHNVKCGICENRLKPEGPRWWTCCDCHEECDSEVHPPWSKRPQILQM